MRRAIHLGVTLAPFFFSLILLAPFTALAADEAPFSGDQVTASDGTVATPLIIDSGSEANVKTVDPTVADPIAADVNAEKSIKPTDGSLGGGEGQSSALMGGSGGGTTSSGQSFNQIYSGQADAFSRIDEQTGALTYDYPLEVPAGRNGMQPDLRLRYNSGSLKDGSVAGYGWDVPVPTIERLNKHGLESLYTDNTFVSSLAGELVPNVVDASGYGTYLPKLATPNYVEFEYLSSGSWKATDSMGRIYTFGVYSSAKLADPADSSRVYRWYVESIIDPNANGILYTYISDGGQVYLDNIEYTTNGASAGYYDVKVTYETRPDAIVTNESGFEVTINKRIDKIEVLVNSVLRKKFDFTYSLGNNGNRSLLSEVVITGYDGAGTPTALPALSFSYTDNALDYEETGGNTLASLNYAPLGDIRFADINGDGYVDAMHSYQTSNRAVDFFQDTVYLNQEGQWVEDSNWTIPIPLGIDSFNIYDQCANVTDVNGDGLADIVYKNTSTINKLTGGTYDQGVYLNNGSGWTLDSSWTVPINICNGDHDLGVRLIDINGDGLVDIIKSEETSNSPVTLDQEVYLNNGNGWTLDTNFTLPNFGFVFINGYDAGVRFADVNGDGLPDMLRSLLKDADNNSSTFTLNTAYVDDGVYINTGSGWDLSSTWNIPSTLNPDNFIFALDANSCTSCSPNDYGTRMLDFNGDGLVDLMDYDINTSFPEQSGKFYVNNGEEFVEDANLNLPATLVGWGTINCSLSPHAMERETLILDINGDGMDDYYMHRNLGTNCIESQIAQGSSTAEQDGDYFIPQDLLQEVILPTGGSMSVAYYPSSHYTDTNGLLNGDMRFDLTTVKTVTFDDGLDTSGTYEYEYSGGEVYYDSSAPQEKKFAGFHLITVTRPDGGQVKRYFHQGNGVDSATYEGTDSWGRIGYMYRQESLDDTGQLMELQINTWDETAIGTTDSTFVAPNTEMHLTYDGDGDHKDTLVDYTHDADTGNLTYELYLGEVSGNTDGTYTDIGNDSITKEYVYAIHSTGLIRGMVQTEYTRDTWLNTAKQTRFYYDGITYLGTVIKGNVTKKAEWINGVSYEDTTYVYDSYGLVTSSTDPEAAVTTFTYDSQKLFPLTVTNDLSQATSYTYDYATGKILTTTDPNSAVFETVYDGLGRPLTEKQPIVGGGGTENVRTYEYVDNTVPTRVKQVDWLNSTVSAEKYTYFDGFGRGIQTRVEHETADTYSTADSIYDAMGRLVQKSLPYNLTGSSYTAPTTNTDLLETYTYDTLDRVTSIENAAGTTTSTYDQWITVETDANGEVKEYAYDWRQLLLSVKENISGVAKTTTYTYNTNGNLLSYTDSVGNVRNFTYNARLERLTAQDLHATSDSQYGAWTFTYNKTNNILTITDANGKVITNTYDDLHRILTENDPATVGTDVTYTYDTCTKGVGRLCSVTGINGVTTAYTYDLLGRVATMTKTIDAVARTTTYTYDRQGNITVQTHPDGSKNEFTFGTAGRVSVVAWRDAVGALSTLMNSVTYGPTGAPTFVHAVTNVDTTYTYDATKLYRLINKKSVKGTAEYQDFTYTYDAVGNITDIVDAPTIYAQVTHHMVYDDVHRLTSAVATSTDPNLAGTKAFTYDSLGSLLTSPLGSYTYNSTGAGVYSNPHAATTVAGISYTYDKNGNLTSDGTWTNTWDFKNRLVTSAKVGNTVSYLYDYLGNRVKKTDTAVAVPTYYVTPEYEIEGSDIRHHVIAPGLGNIVTIITGGAFTKYRYHLTDHLGGTHVETDGAGTLHQYLNYEPYGKVRYNFQAGAWNNDYKFTGKEQDSETNWQYFGARYYDNNRGQFMSADTLFVYMGDGPAVGSITGREKAMDAALHDPQLLNSYSYARGNPITNTDSTGNFIDTALDVISFTLSARAAYVNPTFMSGVWLGLDTVPLIIPGLPAVVGYVRHGENVAQIAKYFAKVERRSGVSVANTVNLFARNVHFRFTKRAWSAGEAGNNLASLIGHYALHGSEVGATSVKNYYNKANDLINSVDNKNVFKIKNGNGTINYFDKRNNTLVGVNSSGQISTYHKVSDPNKLGTILNSIK